MDSIVCGPRPPTAWTSPLCYVFFSIVNFLPLVIFLQCSGNSVAGGRLCLFAM